MKAYVLGFEWERLDGYGKHLSLDELGERLVAMNDKEFEFESFQRLIYAQADKSRIIGLLLTAKNHKKFCELRKEGEVRKINVREAEKGASLVDFNFFLIDKTHGRGLYQYYHNSCKASRFSQFCEKQFDHIAAEKIAAEIAAKGGAARCSLEDEDAIREKYAGEIICRMHVRKENFAELIAQLRTIRSCDFTLSTIEPEKASWFRMISGVARHVRHHVSFQRASTVKERASAIVRLVSSGKTSETAVAGVDEDGLDRIIAIRDNPDSFGNWEFDSIASGMTFDPKDFATSEFMTTLVNLADKHKDFLTKKAK